MTEQELREKLVQLMADAYYSLSTDAVYASFVAVTRAAELAYVSELTEAVSK